MHAPAALALVQPRHGSAPGLLAPKICAFPLANGFEPARSASEPRCGPERIAMQGRKRSSGKRVPSVDREHACVESFGHEGARGVAVHS
jgi:hypothetical protein